MTKNKNNSVVNVSTNWSLILKDNKKAIQNFVDGASLRSVVGHLKTEEAKTEIYRLERYVAASTARDRAKRALSRLTKTSK